MQVADTVGVVVIGRNEGDRLRRCLLSISDVPVRVYVDSGSRDNSCELARSLGADVVELASPPGFTAARARNAGIDRLRVLAPHLEFVQVVDGDCVVAPDWLEVAVPQLAAMPDVAALFGRRRELYPDANLYHRACDREWASPVGSVRSCGGDALIRLSAFLEVSKFNAELIAGEEPDLCLRLRQAGWSIWSNGQEMTGHDADISRFSQWWQRSRRAGFAIAQLARMHGNHAEPSWRRFIASATFWSFVLAGATFLPLLALLVSGTLALAILTGAALALGVQITRLAGKLEGSSRLKSRIIDSALVIVTKIATLHGIAEFHVKKLTATQFKLIEYKDKSA